MALKIEIKNDKDKVVWVGDFNPESSDIDSKVQALLDEIQEVLVESLDAEIEGDDA
jgi:hypothetical protein